MWFSEVETHSHLLVYPLPWSLIFLVVPWDPAHLCYPVKKAKSKLNLWGVFPEDESAITVPVLRRGGEVKRGFRGL